MGGPQADQRVTVGARPEAFRLGEGEAVAQVVETRFAGSTVAVTLRSGDLTALARVHPADAPEPGADVRVTLDPRFCVLFPKAEVVRP
jgi:ABC-type sugar transport system ATPase subunit